MVDSDFDIKKTLEENRKLIEENNSLIRKIHRSIVVGRTVRIIYWLVIIGTAFGAYYFIQPYIDNVLEAYDNVKAGFNQAQEAGNSIKKFNGIDSFVNSIGSLKR